MATTLVPETGNATPPPTPDGLRFVAVRANLLPDEVVSARQVVVVRKRVLIGLATVVLLLVGLYAVSWRQTSTARDDLASAQRTHDALRSQQNRYAPLVTAQSQELAIRTELQKLMVGDLSWKAMLTRVRAAAPAGVALSTITGTTTTGAAGAQAGAAAGPSLNASGKLQVGTLNLSGTSPDKNSIAAYADRLAKVPGLTAPLISNVSSTGSSVTFNIDVLITSDAFGGRYSAAATASTGGH